MITIKFLMPYMENAKCAGIEDDVVFFPGLNQGSKAAKVLCKGCPESTKCFDWSMANHPQEGIWAGTTLTQRERMKKRR